MPGTASRDKIDEPCRECRERHLKCDNERPRCKQCARMNHACQRTSGTLKFKSGSSAKHDKQFGKDQTWVKPLEGEAQFVDEGPDLRLLYDGDEIQETTATVRRVVVEGHDQYGSYLKRTPSASTTRSNSSWIPPPTDTPKYRTGSIPSRATISPATVQEIQTPLTPLKRPFPDEGFARVLPPSLPSIHENFPPGFLPERKGEPDDQDMRDVYNIYPHDRQDTNDQHGSIMPVPRQVKAEYRRLEDDAAGSIPTIDLSPEQWRAHFKWPNEETTYLCECLMRYFIEELSPWFDVGDPNRTFATAVPYKASFNPPLLNAIFMASSRHLLSRNNFRDPNGIIVYKGIPLAKLNSNVPAKFLDAVIQYLKRAFDQKFLSDPETLAAAVILRFASDFEESLTGKEEIAVTSTYQSFIRSRAEIQADISLSPPTHQHWMQSSHAPQNSTASYHIIEKQNQRKAKETLMTFEHACHRVALRQDVLAGIMYISRQAKRPALDVEISTASTWSALSHFPSQNGTEDFIWTDLHLKHLAQVLRAFMERMDSSKPEFRDEQYQELRQWQTKWEKGKPFSFAPYRNKPGNRLQSSTYPATPFTLPSTWLMGEFQVVGNQYINLARILLAELKPLPGIGPERYKTSADIRELVFSICGMAANTSKSIFAKEIAYATVTLAGPHFHLPEEQNELLKAVHGLEWDFGWPVDTRINNLLRDWRRLPRAVPDAAVVKQRGSVTPSNHAHLSPAAL